MARMRLGLASVLMAVASILGTGTVDAATVAYYQWENGTTGERPHGKDVLPDSSGNGLDAWACGGLKYEASSVPGSTLAMRFNGRTGRVWVPDDPRLELTHSLTLEAYVYLRAAEAGMVMIRSDQRYDYDPYYLLVRSDGRLQFLIEQEAGMAAVLVSPSALPLHQWLHMAGTLDDATGIMGLYINGEPVASTVTPLRPFAHLKGKYAGLAIGSNIKGSPDDVYFFHGSIDDVRISDVALDPSQFLPPP